MKRPIVHRIDGKEHPLELRWSTGEDLANILEWLKEEDRLGIHGNFLCNWNLTEQCHQEGTLLVLIDKIQSLPIGYQWGRLLHSGILQIRHDWRRKGLGRLIVEYCIELAQQQDEAVLHIECKPSSSKPFWKEMGFEIVPGVSGSNEKGERVLTRQLDLPGEGVSVETRISSYPDGRKWQADTPPLSTLSPHAIRGTDGNVYLAERAAFSSGVRNEVRDLVIEITIDGAVIYRDKAKYETAQRHGVRRCRNGFFLDYVAPCTQ